MIMREIWETLTENGITLNKDYPFAIKNNGATTVYAAYVKSLPKVGSPKVYIKCFTRKSGFSFSWETYSLKKDGQLVFDHYSELYNLESDYYKDFVNMFSQDIVVVNVD